MNETWFALRSRRVAGFNFRNVGCCWTWDVLERVPPLPPLPLLNIPPVFEQNVGGTPACVLCSRQQFRSTAIILYCTQCINVFRFHVIRQTKYSKMISVRRIVCLCVSTGGREVLINAIVHPLRVVGTWLDVKSERSIINIRKKNNYKAPFYFLHEITSVRSNQDVPTCRNCVQRDGCHQQHNLIFCMARKRYKYILL